MSEEEKAQAFTEVLMDSPLLSMNDVAAALAVSGMPTDARWVEAFQVVLVASIEARLDKQAKGGAG